MEKPVPPGVPAMESSQTSFQLNPIGHIRTRFIAQTGTPIQAAMVAEERGTIEVLPEFAEGLTDIEGFSHLFLIYVFDRIAGSALKVIPYLDTIEHGIFATRSPKRPNPIGLSVVRLLRIDGTKLEVAGVDMLDGTPILDIKPYVPAFDSHSAGAIGWYKDRLPKEPGAVVLADDRFEAAPRRGRGPNARLIARCLCIENDRVLLVRHRSSRTGSDFWTLPGGFTESGETLAEAGCRELCEETGLNGVPIGIAGIFELPESDLCEIILRFDRVSGTAHLGSDPDLPAGVETVLRELAWVPLSGLPPLQPSAFFEALTRNGPESLPLLPLPRRISLD